MTRPGTPTLSTGRLVLRPVTRADAPAFWPAFSDAAHMRYWSRAPFTDRTEFADYLTDENWGGRTWIACCADSGEPVTRVVASTADDPAVSEVGFIARPGHARQGYTAEALGAVLDLLFAAEGQRRVWADIDPDNAASNALVEKLGFTCEGRLRAAWETHIGVRDSLIWGMLPQDWPAARG